MNLFHIFYATQSTTPVIGHLAQFFGYIMNAIYNFFGNNFGIYSIGISIIVFTVITKTLLLPLAIKQQKSMKKVQAMQPELKAVQEKYKGKKDAESQKKMQAEMSALYTKHGTSPFGGCLPVLVQMPIIFSLFAVLRSMPGYINDVGQKYGEIANKILESNHLSGAQWENFYASFPDITAFVHQVVDQLHQIYSFFGINLAEKPNLMGIGILIPVLNVVVQFFVMKSTQDNNQNNQMNKGMLYTMPLMSGFFAITLPSGLGLYWLIGGIYQYFQQIIINKIVHKEDNEKDRKGSK